MSLRTTCTRAATALATTLVLAAAAGAQTIYSPVAGTIDAGGPGFGPLSSTFDQSGLSVGFTSGVTNFAAYLALNPIHSYVFAGNEWFSESGVTAATVTYDLGSVLGVTRLALWNEDASGIGNLDLFSSVDGVTYTSLASGLAGTDWPINQDYTADVFSWSTTNMRYLRFDMSRCPQPDGGSLFQGCAIGEVAVEAGPAVTTPEPASMLLMATGLAGLGLATRRRRRSA